MTTNNNTMKHDKDSNNVYDYNDFFYINDNSYFDPSDEDDENEDFFGIFKNEILKPIPKNTNHIHISDMETKKDNHSKKKKNRNIKRKNKRNPLQFQYNFTREDILCMDFQRFKEYLNLKINGEKKKKVMKESLIIIYNQLQMNLEVGALSRDEKRDKNKILMKLYQNYTDVIKCIETIPDFLNPVWTLLQQKLKKKKEKLDRKRALAKDS